MILLHLLLRFLLSLAKAIFFGKQVLVPRNHVPGVVRGELFDQLSKVLLEDLP